jgi:hypothetical protein
MRHELIGEMEQALGWIGARNLGREFVRGTMTDASLCQRLLTPMKLLDLIMRRSVSHPQVRCFQHGQDVHPNYYLTSEQTRRGQSLPVVEMRRLAGLLKEGCTLAVDSVNSFDPTLEVACRALQWWAHELVQVNVYLTTNNAAGFQLHWDDHDVIIVQLAGQKSWEVRGLSRPAPMYRDAARNSSAPEDVVWAGTMGAGDVMHIPRGYWHTATRVDNGDGFSLHVTFGLAQRTGVDWLTWIADHAREDEQFRHDLDPHDATQAQQLVKAAAQLLACRTFPSYLAGRERERPSARHIITQGIFGPPTAVVCVSEFPPIIEHDGDYIVVSASGKRITFSTTAEPVLRALLSCHPVNISELEHGTDVDVAAVVDTLLAEEVCAEATAELAAGYAGWVS